MSTKALKLRSSFVLLVTATILLQHAGATSSATSDACVDVTQTCSMDSECGDCFTAYTDYMDEWIECTTNFERDGEYWCAQYASIACCMDSYSANDCMGNSAFFGFYTCLANYASAEFGGSGECSLTCNYGSGGGVVDDDATGTDITTETGDDAVGSDDATEADDGAFLNDDVTASDDGGVGNYNGTATEDGAVDNDDDADSSANTGGTSGAGNSSPSAMLTYALGVAFLSAAPFYDVLL